MPVNTLHGGEHTMARWILVLLLAAAPAGAQDWEDTFDAPELDKRWTWRAPVEGPAYSLAERPGWLRIRVPQRAGGFNHWSKPALVDAAPQMRIALPPGDWEMEARIQLAQGEPGSNFHLGLVLGAADDSLVAWGPFLGSGLPLGPKEPEVWLQATGANAQGMVRVDARDVTLRLAKIGNTCVAAVRRGDGDWAEGGQRVLPDPPRFAGFLGKTFLDGPGVTFDVEYVRFLTRAAQPAVGRRRSSRQSAVAVGSRQSAVGSSSRQAAVAAGSSSRRWWAAAPAREGEPQGTGEHSPRATLAGV